MAGDREDREKEIDTKNVSNPEIVEYFPLVDILTFFGLLTIFKFF